MSAIKPRRDHLPVAPVLPLMRDWRVRTDLSWEKLADLTGISEREIRRWLNGEAHSIHVDNADRLAIELGLTLSNIWHWSSEDLGDPLEVECAAPGCHVTFEPRRGRQFCSNACKQRDYRMRKAWA